MSRRSGGGIPVKFVHSSGKELEIDYIYPAGVTIDIEHHMVHESDHYYVEDYDNEVDILVPKQWLIVVPDTSIRIHFFFDAFASGGGLWELYEDTTVTAGNEGTPLTVFNNDRNSNNNCCLSVYSDPTVGVIGIQIHVHLLPSAGKQEGAISARQQEIILKNNTKYLIQFTPVANNTEAAINLEIYEVA